MDPDNDPSSLFSSLMKEVSEKQWETFKRKRRTGDLLISEVMSDTDGSHESEDEIDNIETSEPIVPAREHVLSFQTPRVDHEMIKRYIDNQISFDELANVMEKTSRNDTSQLENLDHTVEMVLEADKDHIDEDEEMSSDPEWVPETSKKRRSRANKGETGRVRARKSKLPQDLKGLVGQANLYFAQGRHEDAIAMCSEVIRQVPTAPEPFHTLGMLYEEMGEFEKAFQYHLIAAYLSPSDCGQWIKVAEMAVEQNKLQLAVKCYSKAIRLNPSNLGLHYERCKLFEKIGDPKKALDGYMSMLKELKAYQGEYALVLATQIAKIHFENNDLDSSLAVMESTFMKFKESACTEDVNYYLELLILKGNFLKALQCFKDYCEVQFMADGQPIASFDESSWSSTPTEKVDIILPPHFYLIDLKSKLVVSLINLHCVRPVRTIIREITSKSAEEVSDLYSDIADAYLTIGLHSEAEPLLAALVGAKTLDPSKISQVWLRYARCLYELGKIEQSISAYHEVTRRDSDNHEARIELTDILIKIGRPEDATSVSNQEDSALVNTELLELRCDLLYKQEMWKDFVQAAKILLSGEMEFLKHHRELSVMTSSAAFSRRLENLGEVRHELQLGQNPDIDFNFVGKKLDFNDFIHLYLKLCRIVYEKLNDKEELVRISLSLYTSPFSDGEFGKYLDFHALMGLFSARDDKYTYQITKTVLSKNLTNNQLWNLFCAIINVIYQDLRHNKFCLRQLVKCPDSLPLFFLNGHSALISGSYKHSLGEYVNAHKANPKDPLAVLCIALNFLHFASQKFTNNPHSTVLQMSAFLNMYLDLRGECQETFYNIGRAFHQLNLLNEAIHFYHKALECPTSIVCHSRVEKERFDLKREISFNLSLIYRQSGSEGLALHYLRKYFVI
ncbi:general transcription factor 3C polypeptide 3 [Brevipalpus obovatus]|uniref:general transcription factor 3C polypeptide 3 n=1 Tax=Brevipalpus obovatus TaxID=246614 RepID=UPI003D9E48A6